MDETGVDVVSEQAPLLETKLFAPGRRPGLVARPRLIERLDQGTRRKLALVSAPAGFGKTTLLADWLASDPARARRTAWVALDPGDNDPARFWTYVMSALRTVLPEVGARALASIRAPQPPPIEAVLTTLINELSATDGDVVLVLDDYHAIDAQPIHAATTFLLDHMPPRFHLVIAGRADPPLPLARLRVRGESTELRAADLRFTHAETAAFLNEVVGLDLSPEDLAALESRAEGWIAGLQLAALSMQGRDDVSAFVRAFAGDDRYVVDYLVEEVLQRQTGETRDFLLRTSILDRLNGSLCDAVTGRNDGKATLEALERGNLFVVPLDNKRHWYRYHHLFADVLRAHLAEELPGRIPALRRRAAAWFEGQRMMADGIEQAVAAGDHETVARLLVAHSDAFDRSGHHASVARWAASLPEAMLRERPRLALIHAAAAMGIESSLANARRLTGWAEEAIARIERDGGIDPLNDVNGTVVGPDGLDALKGEVIAHRLMHSSRDLSPDEVTALADRGLALVPAGKPRVRGMILLVRAGIQAERSDPDSAFAILDQSAVEARRIQNHALLANLLDHRGQVCVALGRLDQAIESFQEAMAAWRRDGVDDPWTLCGPRTWLAEILLERGDLAGATEHIGAELSRSDSFPMRSPILYLRAISAQVLLAAGERDAALEQLREAEKFAHGVRRFRFASFLASVQLKVHTRSGDLQAAAAVVRERGLTPDTPVDDANEAEMTAYARYLLMRGESTDAARVLSEVLPVARRARRVQHEIHALALQALAHEVSGDRESALAALGRATMLGEPGQFNRTFTGEGPVMLGLLAALADAVRRGHGPEEVGSQRYLSGLLGATAATPHVAPVAFAPAALPEPLTERELEILRLIAAGMRNQEIADRLFISPATVKRHIANAYGKLDVGHRTEAVARAGELNLL